MSGLHGQPPLNIEQNGNPLGAGPVDSADSQSILIQEGENSDHQMYFDPNASFTVRFGDAYTFRNLIEYINSTNNIGTFVFSKDSIRYIQEVELSDDGEIKNSVLNDITIDPSDLIEYHYSSIYPELPVKINIDTMRCITRDIQKKDQLIMSKVPLDDTIFLKIDASGSADQANVGHLKPIKISEIQSYTVDDYVRSENDPNCVVMSSVFAKACTSFPHIGSDAVEIRGYQNGVTITAKIPNSTAGKAFRFGSVTDQELSDAVNTPKNAITPISTSNNGGLILDIIPEESAASAVQIGPGKSENSVPTLNISISNMRSLSKINNLSSNGIIKIYVENDSVGEALPLKLLAYVGNYGKIRIYVRDS